VRRQRHTFRGRDQASSTTRFGGGGGRLRGVTLLLGLSALLVALPGTSWADSGNLLPNGSFQNGTTGWKASNSVLSIASDGDGDAFAGHVALSGTATSYQLAAAPRPVQSTGAGLTYTAAGVVRSDTPGKSVCLQLREVTSTGTVVHSATAACRVTTTTWTAFPAESITAQQNGDQIAFLVRRVSGAVAGESFEVDNLSLTGSGGGDTTAPTVPTGVSASAVSSTEIDVSWNASTDPDFGGVAGYTVYRDGGATPIATVTGGSTTVYHDTSVGPNETHTYTVAAFDSSGNDSAQSSPPASATTPPAPTPTTVGLWHLDELSGTTATDSSGFGNNGTISGTVALGSPGEQNTAYQFTRGAVSIPNNAGLEPGTANITVSYWVNLTVLPTSGDYDIFVKGSSTSAGGQIKLEIQINGQASCMFRGSLGKKQIQFGPNLADGAWHHVVCQRTGTQIVETVDGASTSFTKATGAITDTDPIRFGSHSGGGDWYKGLLDEVSYTIG
jgi:Concanavalin A-like lectin/glucanases superfamily